MPGMTDTVEYISGVRQTRLFDVDVDAPLTPMMKKAARESIQHLNQLVTNPMVTTELPMACYKLEAAKYLINLYLQVESTNHDRLGLVKPEHL